MSLFFFLEQGSLWIFFKGLTWLIIHFFFMFPVVVVS